MKPTTCTLLLSIFISTSLRVSGNNVPIIGRTYCIYAPLVFFTLYGWLSSLHTRQPPILTPWCRVILEKLPGLQLVKKFLAFYGTWRFITALTSVCHLSLSWACPIQSTYPHPTSWRSILILSTHLCLGLPSGLFTSGFPTKTLYAPLSSPIRATCHTGRDLPILFLIRQNSSLFRVCSFFYTHTQ